MKNESLVAKRLFACLIDLLLFYLPSILCTNILRIPIFASVSVFITVVVVTCLFVIFILRDYLFMGRSLGKRMLKLAVLDAKTLSVPSAKQLIIKGIFFFLSSIEILFLFLSGKSLGERASDTIVVNEYQYAYTDPLSRPISVKSNAELKKHVQVAVKTGLCFALPMFLGISLILGIAKRQDNYTIAHSYLVNSETFKDNDNERSRIVLTGYSLGKRVNDSCEITSEIVTFTFLAQGQPYRVVCHQDGDTWYVCSDCTEFQ